MRYQRLVRDCDMEWEVTATVLCAFNNWIVNIQDGGDDLGLNIYFMGRRLIEGDLERLKCGAVLWAATYDAGSVLVATPFTVLSELKGDGQPIQVSPRENLYECKVLGLVNPDSMTSNLSLRDRFYVEVVTGRRKKG